MTSSSRLWLTEPYRCGGRDHTLSAFAVSGDTTTFPGWVDVSFIRRVMGETAFIWATEHGVLREHKPIGAVL